MIVELHMLQNFAPSCLNRDDTGSPKECEFGGYRRARISSQCIKRAIREYFKEASLKEKPLISPESLAKRTKLLHDELVKRFKNAGKPEEEAKKASAEAIEAVSLKFKDGDKTEYLLFMGEQEIDAVASTVLAHWTELTLAETDEKKLKAIGDELKSKLTGGKAVDLALFGRMLADLPGKNIDAACQVAHAISTNKVNVEFDYFTAVDDLQPKETTGAGMVGTMEFNSACYYRYANIDLGQLKDNLGADKELARKTIQAFIRAAVAAVPSGKQTSMSAPNPPSFVFAVVRDSGTWSLANAFARPVYPGKDDLIQLSADAMVGYWNKLVKAYGSAGIKAKVALSLDDASFTGLEKAGSLDDLISTVDKAITF